MSASDAKPFTEEELEEVRNRISPALGGWAPAPELRRFFPVALNEQRRPLATLEAERARREGLVASYEAKVDDLRRETLRVSAALSACAQRGIRSPRHVLGEAGYGWDAAMEYVEAAMNEALAHPEPVAGEEEGAWNR